MATTLDSAGSSQTSRRTPPARPTTCYDYYDSPRHNVSCRPEDSRHVQLPDAAEPFASYPADASPGSVAAVGETYEHAFAVPGTYVYACISHQGSGMVGRVHVE